MVWNAAGASTQTWVPRASTPPPTPHDSAVVLGFATGIMFYRARWVLWSILGILMGPMGFTGVLLSLIILQLRVEKNGKERTLILTLQGP